MLFRLLNNLSSSITSAIELLHGTQLQSRIQILVTCLIYQYYCHIITVIIGLMVISNSCVCACLHLMTPNITICQDMPYKLCVITD